MHPIFFSVAGEDTEFARSIWEKFTPDTIYLYSDSGEVGVRFWEEIERVELPAAECAVIFWSRYFLNNPGTQRELRLISTLFSRGHLARVLIIRLDGTGPSPTDGEDDEEVLAVYQFL